MNPFVFSTYRRGDIVIKSSVLDSEDEYMIVAHAFLQKLIREFARLSVKCCRPKINAINMPYYYTERRLDTVVLPAISKICDGVVLTELPVIREVSGEAIGSCIGRADYWCIFRGYTFVIEMKGAFMYYDGGAVREHSVKKRWGEMISQLRNVKEECRFRRLYQRNHSPGSAFYYILCQRETR